MKHFIFVLFFLAISFFLISQQASAVLLRPFGGKIINTTVPGVTCAAQYGLMTIIPAGLFPPTTYVITATTKNVAAGGWILGLYNPQPQTGVCYTDTAPPVTIPSLDIRTFGVSQPLSF